MGWFTDARTFGKSLARLLGLSRPALRGLARSGYFRPDLEDCGRERILLLAPGWLGDVFWASQVARPLAERFGGGALWVATSPRARGLWRGVVADERVIEAPGLVSDRLREGANWRSLWSEAARLRAEGFDLVLDLCSNPFSALVAFAARPARSVGLALHELAELYSVAQPPPARGSHLALRPWHVAAPLLETAPPEAPPEPRPLPLPGSVAGRWAALEALGLEPRAALAVLAPGAGWAGKRWPAARFARLAEALEERQFEVAAVGSADEEALCAQVVAGTRRGRAIAGADLGGIAVLLASARLVVCNDSGLSHLAAAAGTPTVALFNSTNPALCAPIGPRVSVLRSGCPHRPEGVLHHCHGVPAYPCPETCWEDTTVERVLAAARRLILG
ncbi:MAG: glycosyltransferase family 9 protein [Planctomycetota bacterium]|nr:MAG: glycosyltransferase family 9 protein [Planctomycetota bacterium]